MCSSCHLGVAHEPSAHLGRSISQVSRFLRDDSQGENIEACVPVVLVRLTVGVCTSGSGFTYEEPEWRVDFLIEGRERVDMVNVEVRKGPTFPSTSHILKPVPNHRLAGKKFVSSSTVRRPYSMTGERGRDESRGPHCF